MPKSLSFCAGLLAAALLVHPACAQTTWLEKKLAEIKAALTPPQPAEAAPAPDPDAAAPPAGPTNPKFAAGPKVPQAYAELVAQHAAANNVPASLIHRVIMRESRYQARVVSAGNYGIMQIRLGTARAMGYAGPAEGLLDAATNMTYAVRYLAGAYRAARGNEDLAIALYARGYYARPYKEWGKDVANAAR
jgi:soluble lytic murein transglycosylase-like protein